MKAQMTNINMARELKPHATRSHDASAAASV